MAVFINKKEEVIEVQLTQWGKHLFSQGKLYPSFYAFYDDDIIYDAGYEVSGTTTDRPQVHPRQETQNTIVPRIKNAIRPKIQVNPGMGFLSERSVNINNAGYDVEKEANNKYLRTLGSSSPFSEYAPAWNIKTLEGSTLITGSMVFSGSTADGNRPLTVPKLSASINLEYLKVEGNQAVGDGGEETEIPIWVLQKDEKLLLDVQEINTLLKSNGNFDIEVFKVSDPVEDSPLPPTREKLMFINGDTLGGLILQDQQNPREFERLSTMPGSQPLRLGETESDIISSFPKLDAKYVEYYLSIRVDGEIEDEVVPSEVGLYIPKGNEPVDPC